MKTLKPICLLLSTLLPLTALAQTPEPRVLNFRELSASLESLTGVPAARSEIRAYLNSNLSRFPQYGTLDEITSSFLLAQISYTSLFCGRMLEDEKARPIQSRWVYAQVDFDKPASQLQEAGRQELLLNDLSRQFWGRPLSGPEYADLREEIQSWPTQSTPTPGLANLDGALTGLCATFLSAPALWMEIL